MSDHEQPGSDRKTWMSDETRQHLRQAREEMRASLRTLVPPEYIQHRRAARREALLALRSLLDHALKRLDESGKA
ncbi:MAG: hypothetical protein FJZ97_09610 [Chloroflexi bacterium]|nr:hypothetical protein [Chloroflexota bacterium]